MTKLLLCCSTSQHPRDEHSAKLLLFFCFSVCLQIWKQNIRNIETLHSISMENSLTFAESHFKLFSHDICQHDWPPIFLPLAALKGIRTRMGGGAPRRENISRECNSPFSHQVSLLQ